MKLIPENKLEPQKGRLLISEPFLDDPYFKRTVILLCEHNEKGSFGFVLNKYVEIDMAEIMEDFPRIPSKISLGGPVNNSNLYYIHTLGDLIEGSEHIVGNIYMGGNFEVIRAMLHAGQIAEDEIRFFVGYSGWSETQLNSEIHQKSWYVTEAPGMPIMNTNNDILWAEILKKMGKEFSFIANFPSDPSLN